jgi:hypothetical protein
VLRRLPSEMVQDELWTGHSAPRPAHTFEVGLRSQPLGGTHACKHAVLRRRSCVMNRLWKTWGRTPLEGETLAALGATAPKDGTAAGAPHLLSESQTPGAAPVAGLVRAFHGPMILWISRSWAPVDQGRPDGLLRVRYRLQICRSNAIDTAHNQDDSNPRARDSSAAFGPRFWFLGLFPHLWTGLWTDRHTRWGK